MRDHRLAWYTALLVGGLTLVLAGCGAHRPPAPRLERLGREQVPDTVYISRWPWPEQADSLFRSPGLPQRSTGSPAAYLAVWRKNLGEAAARNGLQLVWPAEGWPECPQAFATQPGPASLVLSLDSLVVHPLKSTGLKRLAQWMNLGLEEDREFGWVETHFHLLRSDGQALEGPSPLVSRRPDTRYTLNHTDRTGLLLGQAARDLVSLFRARGQ
jgi:hypothetical protein